MGKYVYARHGITFNIPALLPSTGVSTYFVTVVYIHPKGNTQEAYTVIFDVIQRLQSISTDAPNFILWDFNHMTLKKTLKNFCPTRQDRTLDICYGSIENVYNLFLFLL